MSEIGKIIKELRTKNNESQSDLAEKLNVTFQSVSKWENEISYPDIFMIKEIAKHYKVSIDYLLCNEENKKDETRIKEFNITLNEESNFCVFDDTKNNPNISYSDKNRHRGPSKCKFKASDDADNIVFAINKEGRLIYAGCKSGHGFASPSDKTYHDDKTNYLNQDCFIIGKKFVPYKEFVNHVKFNYSYEKEIYSFYPTINKKSNFSIYTDKFIQNSIAKVSFNDVNRHRCDCEKEASASDDRHDIVIAIDENGKIIYMSSYCGYGYGSPSDRFYKSENISSDKLDCFYIKPTFTFYKDGRNYMDYEFIIPKNGYVIVGNADDPDFANFMNQLTKQQISVNNRYPNSFGKIPIGGLNDRKLFFEEDALMLQTINYQNLYDDYEFVVPKGGFIILANKFNYDTFSLLKELFLTSLSDEELKNWHNNGLFEYHTLNGQFNSYIFKISNQHLKVIRPISEVEKLSIYSSSIDFPAVLNQLEEKITKKIKKEFESQLADVDELEDQIDDLESRIFDLEERMDDIED